MYREKTKTARMKRKIDMWTERQLQMDYGNVWKLHAETHTYMSGRERKI